MATQSPFPFLDGLLGKLSAGLAPPSWLVHEVQHRTVLFLNHVLMQEGEAMARLARRQGSVALVQWRGFEIRLQATPAGLLDVADAGATPDLAIALVEESPLKLAQGLLHGDKPAIRIDGDVHLASDINWLADNVRWDVEEDLSRLIGDVPAHTLAQGARRVAEALRRFAGPREGSGGGTAP
ncbi:hypothetical protein PY257_03525 [Ramlibacter sp. H39-3-26]|uniref:hypothetical protein n=1 Tax=Curvibacter soli TaxID=3031331 RepID=UPI0023DAD7D5|nr:hypothetical protein [Ramlibacter sp. H39-3-26]MDF1484258.1 hypothetical protein [Ramlibacter sp. H39-3-26]